MFLKVLTAAISLIVALYVVRQFIMKAERVRQRVAAETSRRRQTGRISTLEQDPNTGVYRPRD